MSSHEYEHSWSVEKPSSESHAWSYKHACDACLAEVEVRHGVDWKVTDVVFEDKGRTTKTEVDWSGARRWRCTHTVIAKYKIVRRLSFAALVDQKLIEDKLTIAYQMINVNYGVAEDGN